jgi:serine/threonine protein kinase
LKRPGGTGPVGRKNAAEDALMGLQVHHRSLRAIGDYEVVERLAATDLGAVYKARHPETGDLVAIKVAGPEVTNNPVLLKRFEQEFTVTRSLDHPHLVRALQFGSQGTVPYIVMEFVDGPSLGDRIEREGRLPEGEAVRIITQAAEALQYAHQRGVIHRDVKPDNILLGPDGRARLTDLGLAKDGAAALRLTRPSSGLGTPNFMAPEQFSDAKNADARCDVYALGTTLYMAITGTLPFPARTAVNVWKKKLNNELVPPRKLVQVLSPWVESSIARAVQANPQARPASCLEFIEELNGRGCPPTPAGAEGRAPARPRRPDHRATVRYPSGKDSSCQPLSAEKEVRWTAKVQDISAYGVGLVMSRRFEPRTVLALELAVPDEGPSHRLFVRVARVKALSARRWLLGCVFASRLSDEEVQALL